MRHINGSYTTYFNLRHSRSGHLLQGRYKAILIDADAYAQELSRYIHLNPVRAGVVDRAENYRWSSYRSYVGKKMGPPWLVIDFILGFFGEKLSDARKGYREFVSSFIDHSYENPLKSVVASTILGSVDFVDEIKNKYLSGKKTDPNLPALRELSQRPSIEVIKRDVESMFGEEEKLSKQVSIYFCHKHSGKTLKEIGTYFDIGESAVSQTSRRLDFKIVKDKKLRKKVRVAEEKLKVSRV